jgi:lysophospholipase L1-like esterase/pimeloyl-ACP methyl ester carboxylesterase
MKNFSHCLLASLALCLISLTLQAQIKIACVGNSITYGARIEKREMNSYPAQLQVMLGDGYTVQNFGNSGSTLLKKGNKPYWKQSEFSKALEFKPDMVFIKLGTNDSKLINRPFHNEFKADYSDLIHSFKEANAGVRVVLLLPIPSFATDSNGIYDPVIKNAIIPMTKEVAFENHTELIDLYQLFINHEALLPDKIHPNAEGATIIAKRLFDFIQQKSTQPGPPPIFSKLPKGFTVSNFHGYACADFSLNNRACKVVAPKVVAEGSPWIWRARFWGHEPQTDIALLERGFHVVYCDVVEMYGNNDAIKLWNSFYTFMHHAGLSKKVALEGMSRGGIYIYNWALKNKHKVSCIYADAPVLDMKSWPGGKGKGPGSKTDWEIFKKDFGLTEEDAVAFKDSPLDKAKTIARLHIPMLHVVGDADEVVPVDENTAPFENIIKQQGGNITVIHKPGVGHHPHSLANPTPIVEFILKSTFKN